MSDLINIFNNISIFVSPIFYKLLFMSITAALSGIAILLTEKLLDYKISPLWKNLLWIVMIVALIIPVRAQSNFSMVNGFEHLQQISYREEYNNAKDELYFAQENIDSGLLQEIEIEKMEYQKQKLYIKSVIFDIVVPLIWLFGTVGFILFFTFNRISLMYKLRHNSIENKEFDELLNKCKNEIGVNRNIQIIKQNFVSAPALIGIFSPQILMPVYTENMSKEDLRFVILHELGHYKRKDLWLNELLLFLQCVYWFNPIIWYLFKNFRADIELLNDNFVLKKIGTDKSKDYAKSLVTVLGYSRKISLVPKMICMSDGKKNVERRIKMIKLKEQFKKHKIAIPIICIIFIAVISTMFLTTKAISEQQAVELLENSIKYNDGKIYFTIPKEYGKVEQWNIIIAGRQEFSDGMSMSAHFFEQENQENKWEKGKTYSIDINENNFTELNMDVFLADKAEKSIDLMTYFNNEAIKKIKSIQFQNQEGNPQNFQVVGEFPQQWVVKPYNEESYLPGDFENSVTIYNGDTIIGSIGYSYFNVNDIDIPQEDYYKAVYTELRLSSLYVWDPYTMSFSDDNVETGVAELWYLKPDEIDNYMGQLPNCPAIETKAILSYNKNLGVYIGLAFNPDQIENINIEELAKTIKIMELS